MSVNYNEWVIYALVFFLGLVLGMAAMAGGKWKGRYKAEVRRREELEAENKRLLKESAHQDTLRQAAARDEAKRRTDGPGPL